QLAKIALLVWPLYPAVLLLTSCGGAATSSGNSPGSAQPAPGQSTAQHTFVVMVAEENHAYEQVIGNPSMPYLNSLAQQGALATQYYANMHPSIGNYFALTAGAVCSDRDLLARADQWLKASIGPLLATPRFQSGGLLLITFDESNIADIRNGGGRVPLIAFGPKAKAGSQSASLYKHENTLKT